MKTASSNTTAGTHSPKRYLAAALLCILSLILCGGFLAYAGVPLALAESDAPAGEDRLAGIFITDHYIETEPPLLDVNARGEIVIKEQASDKIYGTLNSIDCTGQSPVTFPGLHGFGIYNLQMWDEELQQSSGYCTQDSIFTELHFTVTDTEELTEASLYVSAGSPCVYYFNPVYQQADGQIYLTQGTGISSDSFSDGQKYSQSLSQSVSRKENGTEETEGYRFSVTITAADAPDDAELLFLTQDGQLLQRLSAEELEMQFQADLPQLEIPADVACLILRQSKKDGSEHTHTLFDRGSGYLEYMVAAEDDFLHPRQLPLVWN